MTEPKRLIDRLQQGPERELLLCGASETAPEDAAERVRARVLEAAAAAAAVTAAASATSATGSAAAGKTGAALAVMFVKWLGIGAVVGGVTALAGSEIAIRAFAPPVEPAPAAVAVERPDEGARGPARPAPRPAVAPQVADAPPAREVRADPKPVRGDVQIGQSATLGEAESLARVRSEATRNPARALVLLDQHMARFPDGLYAAQAKKLHAELVKRTGSTSSDAP